ncbi:MAG: hypothetical protein ACQKBV_13365, partial [Puniceicoccales bacterium]
IKRDYEYLSKLWETIVEKTLASEAPMLINAEGGLVHRAMRDMFEFPRCLSCWPHGSRCRIWRR